MAGSSAHKLIWGLLGLLLIVGGFVAGFFLMTPPRQPSAVSATVPESAPAATVATGPRLVIRKAVYGDLANDPGTDVTDKVKAAFDGTTLSIAASNDNFGDTAPNIVKQLRVDYTLDGREVSKTAAEGETLKIAFPTGPVRLVIRKAVYGDLPDGQKADVTEKVAAGAETGALSIAATNENFGDPAFGTVKKLRVEYTFDGKERTKTVGEGETLAISNSGE